MFRDTSFSIPLGMEIRPVKIAFFIARSISRREYKSTTVNVLESTRHFSPSNSALSKPLLLGGFAKVG